MLDGTFAAIPTVATEVFDVSGAGDTFLSAFVYAREILDSDPEEALSLANRASGIVVSRLGTACISRSDLGL